MRIANRLSNDDQGRIEEAVLSIEDAVRSLTRALCMLGFSEGKEAVQIAHGVVRETHRYIQQQNARGPTGH